VICNGIVDAPTAIASFFVAVCAVELEPLTCTVNEALPACAGIPLIWPDEANNIPVGNDPEAIDQLYGGVPPLADKDVE
jgi:hypothetical protein